jgi:hypothetical protein
MSGDDLYSNRDPIPSSFKDRFLRSSYNAFNQLAVSVNDKLLRVYVGSRSETGTISHSSIIEAACIEMRVRDRGWTVEYLDSSEVRKKGWQHPKQLVDWLLESAIHIIACQGIHVNQMHIWGTTPCEEEIKRLEFHPGIPSGNKLRCPAFTGNKWSYLVAAADVVLPSFKICLNVSTAKRLQNISEAKR